MNSTSSEHYETMWQDFAKKKSRIYRTDKFTPHNRVGLTNYTREHALLREIKKVPHSHVLDVGCASGRQVFQIAPFAEKVVGVDIAPTFIDECNAQKKEVGVSNVSFAVGGFESLPSELFDVVICCEVLEHVIDLEKSIDSLVAKVRSGGHLIITVPHYNADGTLWGRMLRLIGVRNFVPLNDFSLEAIVKHGDAHIREFSQKSLQEKIIPKGFAVAHCSTVSHLDGPYGNLLQDFLLSKLPWIRPLFIQLDRLAEIIVPHCGRHILLVATKSM